MCEIFPKLTCILEKGDFLVWWGAGSVDLVDLGLTVIAPYVPPDVSAGILADTMSVQQTQGQLRPVTTMTGAKICTGVVLGTLLLHVWVWCLECYHCN